jgi:L-cysteine/cystine lyase
MDISSLRDSIPALQNTIYLNSGGSAPSPSTVVSAITSYLVQQSREGPFSPPMFKEEHRVEKGLRQSLAQMIGATEEEVVLTGNTTDGIDIVAGGMDWRSGDEVVTCDQEHSSGLLPWFYLRDRRQIQVQVLSLPASSAGVVKAVEAALTPRTRLISLSHISWCTGMVFPIADVARLARQRGVALVVDGAQGAGHIPLNMKDLGCDFYALPAQKWLMGPHGTGALYVASDSSVELASSRLGWASASQVSPDGSYTMHPDARRFEASTTNHGLLCGFAEAVRLYMERGASENWERIRYLSDYVVGRLRALPGVEMVSPRAADLASGLVAFRVSGHPSPDLSQRLWAESRVVCRWVEPDAVRFSLHVFNTEDEIDRVVRALEQICTGK